MPIRGPIAAIAVVIPLVLAGCSDGGAGRADGGAGRAVPVPSGAAPDGRPVRDGGTLTVALAQDPDELDPTTATTFVGRAVFAGVCEKLYDVDASMNLVPQLAATLPTLSADQRTATIRLRDGVRFNDGTPFDAAAVKKSLDRHRTLKKSARKAELAAVQEVTALDPRTVRITMSRPFSPLTAQLADRAGMIMSPAALDRHGDAFGASPVCAGPFSFVSRTSGNQIVVERSAHYYDRAKVRLDRIIYKIITDPNVRSANLKSEDVQVAERVAPSDVVGLTSDTRTRVVVGGGGGYQGITVNVGNVRGSTEPPGQVNTPLARHPKLREAFELALDRDVINKVVFNGLHEADCSPLPLRGPYRAPGLTCPKRDVIKARALVAETGVPQPVPVTLVVPAQRDQIRLGQVIQGMAKEAGFAVKVQPIEFVTQLDQAKAGGFEATQVGWSGRVDPDGNTTNLITTGGALNYGGLHDPVVDKAIEDAAATTDVAERRRLYTQALDRVAASHAVIYLYHERFYLGMNKKIAGVRIYGDGIPRFTTAGYAK